MSVNLAKTLTSSHKGEKDVFIHPDGTAGIVMSCHMHINENVNEMLLKIMEKIDMVYGETESESPIANLNDSDIFDLFGKQFFNKLTLLESFQSLKKQQNLKVKQFDQYLRFRYFETIVNALVKVSPKIIFYFFIIYYFVGSIKV